MRIDKGFCLLHLLSAAVAFNIDLDAINSRLEQEGLKLEDFNITDEALKDLGSKHENGDSILPTEPH